MFNSSEFKETVSQFPVLQDLYNAYQINVLKLSNLKFNELKYVSSLTSIINDDKFEIDGIRIQRKNDEIIISRNKKQKIKFELNVQNVEMLHSMIMDEKILKFIHAYFDSELELDK